MPPLGIAPTTSPGRRAIEVALAERLGQHGVVHAHRLRRARERARGDVRGPGADGAAMVSRRCGVRPGVARHELAQAEDVGDDLDLPGAAGAGADADGRDAQALGDGRGQLLGHQLQHDREGAGLLDRQRVGEQGSRGIAGLALHADLADLVDGLRRQADVAHDRDAGLDHGLDGARRARRRPRP